jgi:hypothetical protein
MTRRSESNVRPVSISRHMCLGVDTHVFRNSQCGKHVEAAPAHQHEPASTDVSVGRQAAGVSELNAARTVPKDRHQLCNMALSLRQRRPLESEGCHCDCLRLEIRSLPVVHCADVVGLCTVSPPGRPGQVFRSHTER